MQTRCGALKQTMVEFEKLLITLEDFCNLSIFGNKEFLKLAEFKWMATCENQEELISRHGVCLGFNFTINPHGHLNIPQYVDLINSLCKEDEIDRYKSKILIRKIYLENDRIKISSAVNELFNGNQDYINYLLSWIEDNENYGGTSIKLTLPLEKIPDDLVILKLGQKRHINKTQIFGQALTLKDLFDIFLYSGDIHLDNDKRRLFELLKEHFKEFLDALIDLQMVILYNVFEKILIPRLKGHLNNAPQHGV